MLVGVHSCPNYNGEHNKKHHRKYNKEYDY